MDALLQDSSLLLSQSAQMDAERKAGHLKSGPANMEQIEKAAKEFEAVFLSSMLKPMFEQIEVDGVFGGGKGEEVFRGLMVQEYGKMIADNHSVGIAEQVKAEMIRIQEQFSNPVIPAKAGTQMQRTEVPGSPSSRG